MKIRKEPMRSCIVTKEKLPKKELLRIVRGTDGIVMIDTTGKINGRGAYIKKDVAVLNRAIKSKILEKVLETTISDSLYEEIRNIINN